MVAICSMVRKPFNFDTWIEYHLGLGVDWIFIRVEDTPEIKDLVAKYPNVIAEWIDDTTKVDNFWTLIDRQRDFMKSTKLKLDRFKIDWVVHIDSDELLCLNDDIKSFFNKIPEDVQVVRFKNYEAIYDRDDLENPFLQCNRFKYDKKTFDSYVNGKCASRVKNLKWRGPHLFGGKLIEINTTDCLVLHYESPKFEMWYEKFKASSVNTEKFYEIPFEFYRESIITITKENKQQARNYYNKMKVGFDGPYKNLMWTPMQKEKNILWTK